MSKEQTPITAYDLKIMFVEDTGLTTYSNKKEYIEWLEQKVMNREQYAQAKVLEELEREVKYIEELMLLDRVKDDYRNGIEKGLEISRDIIKRSITKQK